VKPSLQFQTREQAELAAAALRKNGIRYDVADIKSDGSVTYPEFVNLKFGGVVLSIEDADWERGMKVMWDANE
jgi:hypothetical protein